MGEWNRVAVAELIDGARFDPSRANFVAAQFRSEWLEGNPDQLRERLRSDGPQELFG